VQPPALAGRALDPLEVLQQPLVAAPARADQPRLVGVDQGLGDVVLIQDGQHIVGRERFRHGGQGCAPRAWRQLSNSANSRMCGLAPTACMTVILKGQARLTGR